MKRILLLLSLSFAALAGAESIDITVRHAPYNVGGASSKSEKAWCPCKYCGSKTSYERKYRWDYDRHEWNETTKSEDVPNVCRKCKAMEKEQEKLDRKERKLDKKIETENTRLRIKAKQRKLEERRQKAR